MYTVSTAFHNVSKRIRYLNQLQPFALGRVLLQPGRVTGPTPTGAVVRGLQLGRRLREEEVEGSAEGQGAAGEKRACRHVLGSEEEKRAERTKDL